MNSCVKLVTLLLLSTLFFSCNRNLFRPTADESINLEINEVDFEYLKAKAKFRFDNGKSDLKATANIRIKKDSVIWMSISATLGIEGARALITRDSLSVIDRLNKNYSVLNYQDLSERYNFNIDYDLVQSILLGNLATPIEEEDNVSKEAQHFKLLQTRGDVQMENRVGLTTRKIERVNWTDAPTNNSMTINYTKFQLIDQIVFPYENQIILKYKEGNLHSTTQINIDYNRAELSSKKERFPFNIPQKYERN